MGREEWQVPSSLTGAGRIQNRILVLSGKGGVGKSTVAVNLAMGFTRQVRWNDLDVLGGGLPSRHGG